MAVGITRITRKLTTNDSRGVSCKTLGEYRDKYLFLIDTGFMIYDYLWNDR